MCVCVYSEYLQLWEGKIQDAGALGPIKLGFLSAHVGQQPPQLKHLKVSLPEANFHFTNKGIITKFSTPDFQRDQY